MDIIFEDFGLFVVLSSPILMVFVIGGIVYYYRLRDKKKLKS